jgi:hypothetical protein
MLTGQHEGEGFVERVTRGDDGPNGRQVESRCLDRHENEVRCLDGATDLVHA